MADSKITALTSISTSTDPAVDPLVIVDVSDTSMAATGTTKKVTLNQLLGAGGTATLASATITGAATVGTTLLVGTNATLTNGNVIIGTSGKGIDFSATTEGSGTMTSELLNDYEEGTFLPTVAGSTIAGVLTAPIANGYYTKVGSLVTVQVYIGWTNLVGATGYMILGGLPFAASSSTNIYSAVSFSYVNYISLTASNVLTGMINPGTSYVELGQYPVGGGASSTVPIDTAASIMYTATYRV